MTDVTTLRTVLSDGELILAARAGDGEAYGELYVRHLQSARAAARALTRSKSDADDVVAEAFSRVLGVLQRGGGPDISFRPYLLTTVRNSFYERTRRTRLEDVTDQPDDVVNVALLDSAASKDDRALVALAFASLPERWQLVLWHTEVEGRSPAEVAPLLGIAPNAVAALAYRAREGLREAYLQSHLQTPMSDACRECVANLGAYVRDSLSARDRRKVDDHLITCTTCPPLLAELSDANTKLRGVLIPLLLGVPAGKYLAGLTVGKGVVAAVKRMPLLQQAAIGTFAASTVAALAIAAASLAGPDQSQRLVAADPPVEVTVSSGTAETRQALPITSASATDETDQTDETGSSSTDDTNATDPVDSTPSNTLADDTVDTVDTADTVTDDSATVPDTIDTPVVTPVRTAPNVPVRTTPTTQPRPPTTPPRSPVVIPPSTAPTTPTTPGTTPTTSATTPTTESTTTTTTTAQGTTTTAPTASTEEATTTSAAPTTVAPPLADPRVGAEVVGRAYVNGSALIRINTANGTTPGGGASRARRAGPAGTVRVTVALPAGVSFNSVDDPAWACTVAGDPATLGCDIPGLADGARSSADIKLAIGAVVSSFSLTPMISADGAAPVAAAGPLVVDVSTIAGSLFADYDTGSVMIIGNSSMSCDVDPEQDPLCIDARRGIGKVDDLNRHDRRMVHVDIDDDQATFNSSSATLNLGSSSVTRAFLVWGAAAELDKSTERPPNPSRRNEVRLTTPDGQVHDVTSTTVSTWKNDGSTYYSAYADVTTLVRAGGQYQIADIQAAQGIAGLAGWSLLVVTHDPEDPLRLLAVTAPDALITEHLAYSLSVPLSAYDGERKVSVAIASFEGDLDIFGDKLTIGSDPVIKNPFDSAVIGAFKPVNVNNFGVDSDLFNTGITDSNLKIDVFSDFDQVELAMFAISADL